MAKYVTSAVPETRSDSTSSNVAWLVPLLLFVPMGTFATPLVAVAARGGQFTIRVVDEDTGKPIAARMHLKDQRGKPVRPPGSVFYRDHFVFDGEIVLKLRAGHYQFELERGHEYLTVYGHFEIEPNADDERLVKLKRFVTMSKEGWWSGDLHVHRSPEDIKLLMRAEDLHVAPLITWWNDTNIWKDRSLPAEPLVQFDGDRFYHLMAGEDERGGGALLFFNLPRPLDIAGAEREYPSSVDFLKQTRDLKGVHVDVEKPFWWDVPIWVASRMTHSMGLCNNHMWRDGVLDGEAWGKPRDKSLYPAPHGNGRWSQEIYYKLLNCGLRIPPSAGSASGVLDNPVGYNRVYVHCGSELTYDAWWRGLREGRVVVTNGPLLRPRVNGRLPGHVFRADEGEQVELDIHLNVLFRSPVEYLEVVQNGEVVHEVRLDDYAKARGQLPPVVFEQSGWMLIRAVTSTPHTYRFGSTGPYYVEIGDKPRISKADAQFFLDWVHERVRKLPLQGDKRAAVVQYHRGARDFWQKRVDEATAP